MTPQPPRPIRAAFDAALAKRYAEIEQLRRERDDLRDVCEENGDHIRTLLADLACVVEQRDTFQAQRDAFLLRLNDMARVVAAADQEIMRLRRNAARND